MSPTLLDITAPGIPRLPQYRTLVGGPEFRALEDFSNEFLALHREALAGYSRRWVADPLHQWSRQWEYPFVRLALETNLASAHSQKRQVLDAGSGLTFFPFFLVENIGTQVTCCDQDATLAGPFESIAGVRHQPVRFDVASLDRLPYATASFDAVYCISVLEHTDHYPAILDEFLRVLRPGAPLVLTFDLSLDGRTDVTPEKAQVLLDHVDARFRRVHGVPVGLFEQLARVDLLTTETARRAGPELLPWRRSLRGDVHDLLRGRWPRAPFYLCSVYCDVWQAP